MWTASSRPTAALRSSGGSPRMATMPRGLPPGARRPMRSARATARPPASRCRRVSTLRCSHGPVGDGRALRPRPCWLRSPPARPAAGIGAAPDAHRLYIGEVRHPIEVKAGESHLNPWLSRRVGYTLVAPNLEPFELKLLGGRLLPGKAGRPAALYMYESASGERFTFYC